LDTADYRATVEAGTPPSRPENGWLIRLPDFGQTAAEGADIFLLDPSGAAVPIKVVYRKPGLRALILAKDLQPQKTYTLYCGGKPPVTACPVWEPEISLLLETRVVTEQREPDSWSGLESLWNRADQSYGADFIDFIGQRGNEFGNHFGFISRYQGWINIPAAEKDLIFYSFGFDAAAVQFDGSPVLKAGVPPNTAAAHPPCPYVPTHEYDVRKKRHFRVEYLQMKNPEGGKIEMEGMASLGLHRPELQAKLDRALKKVNEDDTLSKKEKRAQVESLNPYAPVPPGWYEHPGETTLSPLVHRSGLPAPVIDAELQSFIGWNYKWYFLFKSVLPAEVPAGAVLDWKLGNGFTHTGESLRAVAMGMDPVRVEVQIKKDATVLTGFRLLNLFAKVPEASINNPEDVRDYLNRMAVKDAAALDPGTLDGFMQFAVEFGSSSDVVPLAPAWLALKPSATSPLRGRVLLKHLEAKAQKNPQEALNELSQAMMTLKNPADLNPLAVLEVDILVFLLQSPDALNAAKSLDMKLGGTPEAALGMIRQGDYHRLTGDAGKAVECYLKAQGGKELGKEMAARDEASSFEINDLVENGHREEALAKLREWELRHPMAKYRTDLLLLRARILTDSGRPAEALKELDSFTRMNAEGPYQIDADYYRADALEKLGRRDEALAIWNRIAKEFPQHKLAKWSQSRARQ
jgi:tetratricopeptide (TPR) repeat protein